MAICLVPPKGLIEYRPECSCKNSLHWPHFRTLILAKVLASVSILTPGHRERSLGSARSRLFALASPRKSQLDLFEGMGINDQLVVQLRLFRPGFQYGFPEQANLKYSPVLRIPLDERCTECVGAPLSNQIGAKVCRPLQSLPALRSHGETAM
jgi:hypothetical protein